MKFRYPAIRPLVPPPAAWLPLLQPSYDERWFSNFGPVVKQFEKALTERYGCADECFITASSATSGLAAALIALGVEGDVLLPAYTFPATAAAVLMAGADPVLLDVEMDSWVPSAAVLGDCLASEEIGAVLLVSPFGIRRDFSAQAALCRKYRVPVIIDNAAGLGPRASPLTDEHCFEVYSLHATKAFPIGEGGAVRARTAQARTLQRALNFGLEGGIAIPGAWGINGKLPEIGAAIGLAILREFDAVVRHRQEIAACYMELLRRFPQVCFPTDPEDAPWQVFPLLLPSAEVAQDFMERAATQGLQIRWSYRPALDQWPRTRRLMDCPNARALSSRMVTLPIYSDMTAGERDEIMHIVQATLDSVLLH